MSFRKVELAHNFNSVSAHLAQHDSADSLPKPQPFSQEQSIVLG
jgi:hypothetical protein